MNLLLKIILINTLFFLSIVSKADTAPMSEAALRGLEIAQEHCS